MLTKTDKQVDLIINRLTRAQYNELKENGGISEYELYYITDDEGADVLIERSLSSYYSKSETSSRAELSTEFQKYQPKGSYLTAHQSLEDYYTKDELSTAAQLSTEFSKYQAKGNYLTSHQSLADYYTKDELSSKSQLSSEFAKYQLSGDYLLSSSLSFAYDKGQRKINLNAFDRNIGTVDCSDFIKDGMLSTAYLCSDTLVLKFNTDGPTDPISVNLSSFVDNYNEQINGLSTAITSTTGYIAQNYYMKNAVSSATDLDIAFGNLSASLSAFSETLSCEISANYYKKSETSSSAQLKTEFGKYQAKGTYTTPAQVSAIAEDIATQHSVIIRRWSE